MILAEITIGARHWIWGAIPLLLIGWGALVWSYSRSRPSVGWRLLAGTLKAAGFLALAICLIEPLYTGTRPKPGSNLFVVVADSSRSLQLADQPQGSSRGEQFRQQLKTETPWLTRLGQDFELRRYHFDSQLRPANDFESLTFDGEASGLRGALTSLANRFRNQPVAGILLFTDGNGTDTGETPLDTTGLPPIYPVTTHQAAEQVDLSLTHVAVTQTNFEASPVTITATVDVEGPAGETVVLRLLDEAGVEVDRRSTRRMTGKPVVERFLVRPEKTGISFYTVQASLPGEELIAADAPSKEATLANNRRLATVDRGGGPYRVLYVTGKPNWEYKFLRRALAEDDELRLLGLVRIARREPKLKFLSRSGERTNPLFRGFGNQGDDAAEQYDQPVLLRLGIEDKNELLGGFPKSFEELARYHAVILDDIEAPFFTSDQLSLLQQFVSRRGGGLLMLGGKDSFVEGGYQRSPVGDMLPIYLDQPGLDQSGLGQDQLASAGDGLRLVLTREGWLQSWLRLRSNESDEQQRLQKMPAFRSVNQVRAIKPGASILAEVAEANGTRRPALVAQSFGRGRTGALLIGDLWRWNLRRTDPTDSDLEKSWRQTVRWLVSDVPGRVEAEVRRVKDSIVPSLELLTRARDPQFEPLDNAKVTWRITLPDGQPIQMEATPAERDAGQYVTRFAPRQAGMYRGVVTVLAADGSEVGQREIGWTSEPQTEEFSRLALNIKLLEELAEKTGGEVIDLQQLDQFVSSLPNRKIPLTETWTYPLWHQSSVFLVAIGCLIGEWSVRRWKGLA